MPDRRWRWRARLPSSARHLETVKHDLAGRFEALERAQAELRGEMEALAARQAELVQRTSDVQALLARTYEQLQGWPQALARLREAPGYEDAFVGEPLVTVRIATFNNARLLCERALPSVRAQTYGNLEVLVVGDACTDDTEERVAALGDPRIRFWNRPHRGPYPEEPQARWYVAGIPPINEGALAARGAWIAPLDDDDTWEPDHVEVLLATAQREHAEVAYGAYRAVLDGVDDSPVVRFGRWPPRRGELSLWASVYHAHLREFLYDMNARFAGEPGDWNLARRLWEAGVRFAYVDRVVTTYFIDPVHQEQVEALQHAARLQAGT
jgi:hypothetical protein